MLIYRKQLQEDPGKISKEGIFSVVVVKDIFLTQRCIHILKQNTRVGNQKEHLKQAQHNHRKNQKLNLMSRPEKMSIRIFKKMNLEYFHS